MAGSAAKKRAQDNEKIMNNITYYFFGTTIFHVIFGLLIHFQTIEFSDLFFFAMNAASMGFSFSQISTFSQNGDLNQKGLISFYFDSIYVGGFVMVFSCFWSKTYWLLLLVPCFLGYMAWTTFIAPLWNMKSAVDAKNDQTNASNKKQKIKYSR
eukprot:TRINITY_DN32786_c0_g1_i1.p1 TRINITY_DN32786_c0_g1~~TRINITY_DN32786_c0_g1_i1.p1  ORF type:complete len:154 (-),score=30.99 TRINITY_DN32786_c0_g1_i1:93-554(-)